MALTERARAARRKYQNDWRRKNKDKVRQYNNNFWEKRAEKTAAESEANNGTDESNL